jgi:hypothetical protein
LTEEWGRVYYFFSGKQLFGGGPVIEKTKKQIGKNKAIIFCSFKEV